MPSRRNTVRKMLWTAMRIHRIFTLPELVRSVPGGCSYENAQKFVRNLVKSGYVAAGEFAGGRSGEFRQYRLVKNSGPEVPVLAIGRRESGLKNRGPGTGDWALRLRSAIEETETETEKRGPGTGDWALRLRSAIEETETETERETDGEGDVGAIRESPVTEVTDEP